MLDGHGMIEGEVFVNNFDVEYNGDTYIVYVDQSIDPPTFSPVLRFYILNPKKLFFNTVYGGKVFQLSWLEFAIPEFKRELSTVF